MNDHFLMSQPNTIVLSQDGNALPVESAPVQAETAANSDKKKGNDAVTPMMAQFLNIKKDHPEALLFYRMGDFYELFFEDAVKASAALDITLTKRGKHLGEDIPMCGVPVHSHDAYLQRLIRSGFKVAVCEQVEAPAEAKKRGAKSVVRRDVVRVVTAGTLTEDTLLNARRHNYLGAIAESQADLGLAWIDVSTGDFFTQAIDGKALNAVLSRINPGELLVSDGILGKEAYKESLNDWASVLTPQPSARFDSVNGVKRLQSLFGVKTLDAFGDFGRAEIAAAGALVDYIDLTQKGRVPRLNNPERLSRQAAMEIDAATRRNLELMETLSGTYKGSLLSVIDKTITGAGARLLARRLSAPLTNSQEIDERLDAVQFFTDNDPARDGLRDHLRGSSDLERALSRLSLGRGGPRDLAAIRDGLGLSARIRNDLDKTELGLPHALTQALADLGHHVDLVEKLVQALAPELPVLARDGGFIAKGYAPELDELLGLRDESRRLIANLQSRYVDETAISILKIKHNNVLGYFVEVPARQAEKVPVGAEAPFIHRQTMANAVRYTTVELSDLEGRIAKAADQALALEMSMFEALVEMVTAKASNIALAATALARLDVATGLAQQALDARYCRPQLDNSFDFEILGGRHPVVEAALVDVGDGPFIANNCCLNAVAAEEAGKGEEDGGGEGRLWLLTGPNMAGKSTFLRQNALIAILAQVGSFVPANSARIGIVDRLFSRVGAADDLARGRSTFMVEMVETAAILNQAGPRALVILDEIGRGTATFDGLSIAWAVVEHLHERNQARALFATHYHELTALAPKLDNLICHTMRVREWQNEVIFLHEVTGGAADRSYGIHVGQLAGLPSTVVARAEQILETLEKGDESSALTKLAEELPLFAAMADRPKGHAGARQNDEPSPVEEALAGITVDELSSKQALDLVYQLKGLLVDK